MTKGARLFQGPGARWRTAHAAQMLVGGAPLTRVRDESLGLFDCEEGTKKPVSSDIASDARALSRTDAAREGAHGGESLQHAVRAETKPRVAARSLWRSALLPQAPLHPLLALCTWTRCLLRARALFVAQNRPRVEVRTWPWCGVERATSRGLSSEPALAEHLFFSPVPARRCRDSHAPLQGRCIAASSQHGTSECLRSERVALSSRS